jgi:hypothetical protein
MCRRFPGAEDRYAVDAVPDAGREVILMPVRNLGGAPEWRREGYRIPPRVQTSAFY